MKVFTVTGLSGSGKTTTIECIIKELVRRDFSVGTVKEIHNESFAIDTEGKNTYRHRQAGAGTVTALGLYETDVMYKGKMNIYDLLRHYTEDYVILEGVSDVNVPRIAVAKSLEELKINKLTFLISGVVANNSDNMISDIPVINAITDINKLVDKIIEVVPDLMPDVDIECCGQCGKSCRDLLSLIVKGQARKEDCVLGRNKVKLLIDGKEIDIVPFVDNILYNTVKGLVKELKGYKEGAEIIIKL